jgi:hypothetical protein
MEYGCGGLKAADNLLPLVTQTAGGQIGKALVQPGNEFCDNLAKRGRSPSHS